MVSTSSNTISTYSCSFCEPTEGSMLSVGKPIAPVYSTFAPRSTSWPERLNELPLW